MALFGPSKKEIWRQLSEQLGGTMASSWRGDKVQITHGDWIVTLDTYTVMAGNAPIIFTRMRAPYSNPTGFRFAVSRRGIFTSLATLMGAQDIEIGEPDFDQAFVVKSNDEMHVRRLFADAELRRLLVQQESVSFAVKDDEGWFGTTFPEKADELYCSTHGILKDLDRLKALFDLFAHTLDRLVRLGSADPVGPDVTL